MAQVTNPWLPILSILDYKVFEALRSGQLLGSWDRALRESHPMPGRLQSEAQNGSANRRLPFPLIKRIFAYPMS